MNVLARTGFSFAVVVGIAASARANNVAIGDASNYALLFTGGGTGNQLSISNDTVNGNVGIGGSGILQFSGPGTINGVLNFSAANTGQYNNTNGSNVGPSAVNFGVADVTTALGTVSTLSGNFNGLGNTLAISGTQMINESAGALQTIGGIDYRVFNISTYSETDANTVTIHGDGSGDPVVLEFDGNSNTNLGGQVSLTGGLTADQVLWNFTAIGKNLVLTNNGGLFQGDILAPDMAINFNHVNITGRVLGGDSSNFQFDSGANITAPPSPAPLPSAALGGLAMLGVMGVGRLARRRATS